MAMIMVIGTASVLAIITAVIAVQSISNLRQAGNERAFERSLHVADAGVDQMLYLIKKQKKESQTNYTTGESTPPAFTSVAEEEQWVLARADEAEAAGRLRSTREGDYINMRPEGVSLVYSVGYVPSYDDPKKVRVVRAEYDFAPFEPTTAILTDGDLRLNGSAGVDGSVPNAHGNGDVEVVGSVDVDGYVSASGDYSETGSPSIGDPDNSGGGTPRHDVPEIDPRANYSMSEYDLCPDGSVRAGPEYDAAGVDVNGAPAVASTSDTPCEGSVLGLDGDTYRGWQKQRDDSSKGAVWRYSGTGVDHGVYYIYQGSAEISGSPGSDLAPWEVTLFAESVGSGSVEPDCPHTGGDIDVSGGATMRFNDKGEGLGFVAGRDLEMSGNPGSGFNFVGVHAAHEQFDLSGNPTMEGAVVAEDACDTPGSPAGPTSEVSGSVSITFDGTSVPLGSSIRTTLWLEI